MARVTDTGQLAAGAPGAAEGSVAPATARVPFELIPVVVAGLGLVLAARSSALTLLVAIAIVQAVLAGAWILATRLPGRIGAIVIAALAAAGADVVVSVWPHSRLGPLVGVLGLAVPVMYAHQLFRGAIRSRVVSSLSGIATLLLLEVALPALLQLRHEFPALGEGGRLAGACAGAVAAALVAGLLVDIVLPVPRFDERVPRGLLGVLVGAGVAAATCYLLVRRVDVVGRAGAFGLHFDGGRTAFIGAALGVLAGLVSIGATYAVHDLPADATDASNRISPMRRAARPVVVALVPTALLAPVAFLLCIVSSG